MIDIDSPSTLLNALSQKPKFGSACNGCGVCCLAVPCLLAIDLVQADEHARCPLLEWKEGRFWCGLLNTPHKLIPGMEDKPWADEHLRQTFMATGAFDVGCDSDDMSDDEVRDLMNERFNARNR